MGGAILLDQLMTQKLLAVYFLVIDCIALFQCWYYSGNIKRQVDSDHGFHNADSHYQSNIPLQPYTTTVPTYPTSAFTTGLTQDFQPKDAEYDAKLEQELLSPYNNDLSPLLSPQKPSISTTTTTNNNNNGKKSPALTAGIAMVGLVGFAAFVGLVNTISPGSNSTAAAASDAISTITTTADFQLPSCVRLSNVNPAFTTIGVVISWISAFLYCASRTPQIKSNYDLYKLGIPLDGISPMVFAIAALGNITSGASVLLRNTINREFFIKTFPFILGSFGTIIFDVVILAQIYHYNKKYNERKTFISSQYGEDEL